MPRSSCKGFVLVNTIGLCDSDYQGEVFFKLRNPTDTKITIKSGEKFAQFIIVPTLVPNLNEVNEFTEVTDRGCGSFGSTDKQNIPVTKADIELIKLIKLILDEGDEVLTRNYKVKSHNTLPNILFDSFPVVTLRNTAIDMAIKEMEWFFQEVQNALINYYLGGRNNYQIITTIMMVIVHSLEILNLIMLLSTKLTLY